jgi:hypothetical protein
VKGTKERIHTLQTTLTIHFNYRKDIKICKNSILLFLTLEHLPLTAKGRNFLLCFYEQLLFIDKPKEKKKDSFAEKFATQVIKNLQVEVRNIHVRFEDKYTNPKQPFSIGVSLKELLFRVSLQYYKRAAS